MMVTRKPAQICGHALGGCFEWQIIVQTSIHHTKIDYLRLNVNVSGEAYMMFENETFALIMHKYTYEL